MEFSPLLFFIPWLAILIGAGFLIMQGWMINTDIGGYSKNPKNKKHPEMRDVNKDEKLLYVKFKEDDETNDYDILKRRIEELNDSEYE